MTYADATAVVDDEPDHTCVMAAYRCDHCRKLNVAYIRRPAREIPELSSNDIKDFIDYVNDALCWLPGDHSSPRSFEDVPDHIAEAASEAHKCLQVGALRAAVQLARSVVEATAKEKGITSGVLASKIEEMHKAHLIRPHVREAAHEIRYLGNEMAHGDFVATVTKEDAVEVLGLMDEVLLEVFQSPARVERRRNARLQRNATP
ncbi:DUF4145 domain-containing protein [Actinokineospora sp.]|uniref:DUF4145 domain-containing protein n=1 Tax=Actinokineospora sp. TaxID=1872133 RepID=UPI003D6C44F6